jgi:TonB family protein
MAGIMISWQTELTRCLLQKNLAKGLAIAIALSFLAVWLWHFEFINSDMMNMFEARRVVPVELKPYAEIIRLETGGGQGGGEGGGSLTAPIPPVIPARPIPVPDAVAPTDTLAVTPTVSPAIDSTNAGGTGLPGSSWGSGGTGWGTGSGSGVGLSRAVVTMPRPLVISIPEYPHSARKAKVEGMVELNIKIDETGKVVNAIVLRNTTRDEACAQSAIAAALRCRYQPAHTAAGPDTIWVIRQFQFSLHN